MPHLRRLGFVSIVLVTALAGVGAFTGPSGFSFVSIDYQDYPFTYLFSINNQGVAVGQYGDRNTNVFRAFLRARNGVLMPVEVPGGPDLHGAADINEQGDIVGGCEGGHGYPLRNGVLTFIEVPGAYSTGPGGINSRGDIVGGYIDSSGGYHGFLLTDGVFSTIDYPGAPGSSAYGINARGDIVGTHSQYRAYLLRDGVFSDIVFPGAVATEAVDINDQGDIVGDYTFDYWQTTHAFVLLKGRFIHLDLPGNATAFGINNAGTIVGGYKDAGGAEHGFVATIK